LDLVVSSTEDKVIMIEAQAEELPEKILLEAVEQAKAENKKIIAFINTLRKEIGFEKEQFLVNDNIKKVQDLLSKKYSKEVDVLMQKKANSDDDYYSVLNTLVSEIVEKHEDFDKKTIAQAIEAEIFEHIRNGILKGNKRSDGRKFDEIRPLHVETQVLPRTHGSAIFQRGMTQVMSIATLGATTLEQLIESPEGEETKRYIHHYFSPPYSYGETGRMGWPSRREVGHGALAERAIEPVLPSRDDFPYAIRVVSEVMSSNGSTSMASTCGSSLALMDAGVPIKSAVAGVSIGLMWESDEKYTLLTDIAGIEDFAGYMDFKVAGSEQGITAIQLDVKNNGLTQKMIKEILQRALEGRMFILKAMNKVVNKPRAEVSKYAPKVVILEPPQDKIGEIIGPGGKNIKRIIAQTETDINITDDGKVSISGIDKAAVDRAAEAIQSVYREVKVGEMFDGKVTRILPIGAMVEYLPGREGLIHISKLSDKYIKDPREVVSIGEAVKVKVANIDSQGRMNLALVR
ncbi:polyribonucleotide nucleotidyltransferase, partial [Candidatus Roizmanbacteria bacterium RIFCSPHIGHO2_12_FULL_37_23]